MMQKAIMICWIMFLSGIVYGGNPLNVNRIKKGENLEKAAEVSVSQFFQNRIHNKIKKANVGNWEIFYEDSEWVYYGYPVFQFSLFSNSRTIDSLYKVKLSSLTNEFPGFKTITGIEIRNGLYNRLFNQMKSIDPDITDIRFDGDYEAALALDNIEIRQNIICIYTAVRRKPLQAILSYDKTNGSLKSITMSKNE